MEVMVAQLDKGTMRPAQKESYLCSARCCESAGTQAQLQQCVGACEQRVMVANQLINASIKDFQVVAGLRGLLGIGRGRVWLAAN